MTSSQATLARLEKEITIRKRQKPLTFEAAERGGSSSVPFSFQRARVSRNRQLDIDSLSAGTGIDAEDNIEIPGTKRQRAAVAHLSQGASATITGRPKDLSEKRSAPREQKDQEEEGETSGQ